MEKLLNDGRLGVEERAGKVCNALSGIILEDTNASAAYRLFVLKKHRRHHTERYKGRAYSMFVLKEKTIVSLRVNGLVRDAAVRPGDVLLDTLREQLGLTGAKPGCRNGDCGACTVLLDGLPVKSCLILTAEVPGREITTVEGLVNTPIQRVFIEKFAFQCGYCTSGFLMVCYALSKLNPKPSDAEIDSWLESNICRCTSYEEIGTAVRAVINGEMV